MPAKNSLKLYIENGCYHIYNRGVEKRNIFLNHQDYIVFLHFLKRYLTKPPENPNEVRPRFRSDLFDKIQLICYCLMPNHFHLLIKQSTKEAITIFMRALTNSYVRYFNAKYQRRGVLFETRYKGVLVETEPQLLHLTRYIHCNSIDLIEVGPRPGPTSQGVTDYPYSSYRDYLGWRKTEWVHSEEILTFFKTAQKMSLKDCLSYQSFVEDYKENPEEILGLLTLEEFEE